ncbi:MAG: T9SS type A sorting domain-containing protein [Fluviicola sp.]
MKKRRLLFVLFFLLMKGLHAQNISLSKFLPHEAGSGYRILDMEYMSNGNLVAVGKFTTWSPGYQPGFLDAATGASGGFIVVYDVTGTILWTKVIDGTGEDAVAGIAIDASNNVFVTGYVESTTAVNFGGTNLLPAAGNFNDGFIAQYTPTGTLSYAALFGGNGRDKPSTITENNGFLYIGGMFNNTIDLDPGAGTANFTSAGSPGNMDYFIGAYNASNGGYIAGYTNGEDNGTVNGLEETVFGIRVDGTDVYALVRHWLSPSANTPFGNGVTSGPANSYTALLKLNTSLLPTAVYNFAVEQTDFKFLEFHNGKCLVLGKDYNNELLTVLEINPNLTANNTLQSGPIASGAGFDLTGFSVSGDNLYVSGWSAGTIDLDGNSMPVSVTTEPQVAFLAKINHGPFQFAYEWVEQFGMAPATIYTNGLASTSTKVAFGGIINSNVLSFDPFNTTPIDGVNAHGSTGGFSYAPFFSEYNTCLVPIVTSSADDAKACQSGEVTLTATGAAPIEWYDQPTGGTLFATGNSVTFDVFGSGNLYMQNGCSSTRVAAPFTLVTPPTPSIFGANSPICEGSQSSMVATGVASYLDTYAWTGGGTDGNTTISANAGGTSDFTLTFTASNTTKNCSVTVSELIDVLDMETIQADQSPLCLNNANQQSSISFNVNTTNTSSNYSNFTWTGPMITGGPFTGTSFSYTGSPNGLGYVICSATNSVNGCPGIDTIQITFDYIPEHTVDLSCTEATVGEPLLANETISWLDGNSNNGFSPVFTLDPTASTLQMQIVNDNCVFTANVTYIIPSTDESTIETSGTTLQVVESNNNFTYQWINCTAGTPISGETAATFTPVSNGSYALIIDNGSGCLDTSNCIEATLGITEFTNQQISIYPNPATNGFFISNTQNAQIEIYDVFGRKVLDIDHYNGAEINSSDLNTGLYQVVIKQNDEVVISKLEKL